MIFKERLVFQGIWGKSGSAHSPNGPVFRYSKTDWPGENPEAYMFSRQLYQSFWLFLPGMCGKASTRIRAAHEFPLEVNHK